MKSNYGMCGANVPARSNRMKKNSLKTKLIAFTFFSILSVVANAQSLTAISKAQPVKLNKEALQFSSKLDLRSAEMKAKLSSSGGADSGGGNAVGNELLDFYENNGSVRIVVEETEAYKKVLLPVISEIKRNHFADFELFTFIKANKIWLLEPKVVKTEGCQNESIIRVNAKVVACQSKNEVRISKQWFEDKKTDLKNKAGLLLHELYVSKIIGTPLNERAERERVLRMVVRMTFQPERLSDPSEKTLFSDLVKQFSGWDLIPERLADAIEGHKNTLRTLSPRVQAYCKNKTENEKMSISFILQGVSDEDQNRQYSTALNSLHNFDPSFTADFAKVKATHYGSWLEFDIDKFLTSKSMATLGLTCI